MPKDYDYLLKVLLVGDSDVGKHEIMAGLEDASSESPFCSRSGNCKLNWLLVLLLQFFFQLKTFLHAAYKITTILLDGKRVRLCIWDTSGNCVVVVVYFWPSQFVRYHTQWKYGFYGLGQGRFCTIIRSYSRGAQGVILVYDITNKWSFDGIDRWLKEVEEVRWNINWKIELV